MPARPRTTDPAPPGPSGPLFITTREAAEILGVSRSTVFVLLNAGEIESRYVGQRRQIVLSSFRAYLDRLPDTRAV